MAFRTCAQAERELYPGTVKIGSALIGTFLALARVVVDQRHADRRKRGGQCHRDETSHCTRNPEYGPMAGQQQCSRAEIKVHSQDEYEKGKVQNGYSAAVSRDEECTSFESSTAADVFHDAGLHSYRITRTDP